MTLTRRSFVKISGAAMALPLLGSAAFAQKEKIKIGFIYVGPINDNGYTYAHNQGRLYVEEHLGDKVETIYVENVPEGPDCERVLRELAQQGCNLIFATSFGFGDSVVKVAPQFPDIAFEHATGYMSGANIGLYNARFYEGRAVCGTIAGHMSKTAKCGYIGSFPIPEVIMGINAIALSGRRVNPAFTVKPVYISTWNDPAKEADAARAMIDQGVDVIAQHTDGPAALQVAAERGIIGGFGQGADMSAFAPDTQLTAIIDHWGPHYLASAEAVLAGTWVPGNTWEGLKEDVVEMGPYNAKVPADVVADAEFVRKGQIDGSFNIFAGPIKDNTGVERVPEGSALTDAELLGMDWYVEGVEQPA